MLILAEKKGVTKKSKKKKALTFHQILSKQIRLQENSRISKHLHPYEQYMAISKYITLTLIS